MQKKSRNAKRQKMYVHFENSWKKGKNAFSFSKCIQKKAKIKKKAEMQKKYAKKR